MDINTVYKDLKTLGCCDRCIIRHLTVQNDYMDYNKIDDFLKKIKVEEEPLEPDTKKLKTNPCLVCLDILRDDKLDDIVAGVGASEVLNYDYPDFNVMVNLPKTVSIRAHAIFLYLKEKYVEFYKDKTLLQFNKVFCYSIKDKLAAKLNMQSNRNSNLEITILITYGDDEIEVKNVVKLDSSKFNTGKRVTGLISKNAISDILLCIDDTLFRKQFKIPPEVPTQSAKYKGVTCFTRPVFLGGRYLKLVRNMGQTPWIINDKKVTEHSVQDFLFDAVRKHLFLENKLTFTASGREDADVRMLGTGRPFYIQIENPKSREITAEQIKAIEEDINQSGCVIVRKLQEVHKNQLLLIKFGEQDKRKTYVALCMVKTKNIDDVIDKINQCGVVEIAQKTPIRVLHRRTQAVRMRNIYEMKATRFEGSENLFELTCVTQAGTYVKEFVHGDLERTVPNLGSITGCPMDIVALDVTAIDLKWPNKLNDDVHNLLKNDT